MNKIVHIISLLTLIISFILFPTKKEKVNLSLRITTIILFILSNNILSALILKIVNIPCDLYIYGIINFLISLVAVYKIKKENVIQKYELKVSDIVLIILLLAIIITFAYFQYGKDFNIKYETVDAACHFSAAMNFMKYKKLVFNLDTRIGEYFNFMMIGAYVNEGIFFSLFEDVLDEIDFYKLYILFDLFILFVSGLIMYEILSSFNKKHSVITIIMTILYLLAYPLNAVIMGTQYLSLNIVFMSGIILLFRLKNQIEDKYFKILLFLINLGIAHTYNLLGLIAYGAEFFYLLITQRKKKLKTIFLYVFIPAVSSIMYFMQNEVDAINTLAIKGIMFKNYYSNFIIYIPFVIYIIYNKITEEKKMDLETYMLAITIIIIVIGFILKKQEIISTYYLSKFYYILWIVTIIIATKGILLLLEKCSEVGIGSFIGLLVLLLVSFYFINYQYTDIELIEDIRKEKIWTISEIYKMNFNSINRKIPILNKQEIEIVKKSRQYIDEMEEWDVIGGAAQKNWIYAFYNYVPNGNIYGETEYTFDFSNINSKYLVALKRATVMHLYKTELLEEYQYIFEEKYGGVLKKR